MANSGPPSVGNTSGPLPPDVSIASTVLGIEGGFRVLAIVVVAIRLFSRFARKGAGGLDDVFIGIASVCQKQNRSILNGLTRFRYSQSAAWLQLSCKSSTA